MAPTILPARNRRFGDLLSRLFDRAEAPLLIGPASPSLALDTEDAAELDLLRGWRRYAVTLDVPANVGQFGELILNNPAVSKTLLRLEGIGLESGGANTIRIGLAFGGALGAFTARGGGNPMDGRNRVVGGFQRSAADLWTRTTAAGFGGTACEFYFIAAADALKLFTLTRPETRYVLEPGSQLVFTANALNTGIQVNLFWLERSLEKSELLPVL